MRNEEGRYTINGNALGLEDVYEQDIELAKRKESGVVACIIS